MTVQATIGLGDCPDFRVSENGTVPFGRRKLRNIVPRMPITKRIAVTGPQLFHTKRSANRAQKSGSRRIAGCWKTKYLPPCEGLAD